ncbi:MAG: hypothetical protein LBF88_09765 [Planctomycetaceae bacterium]|nr:hypothetical protein [Planctomycetaceae bacterium]
MDSATSGIIAVWVVIRLRHSQLSTINYGMLPFQDDFIGDSYPPRCGGLAYVALSGRILF